MPTTDTTQSPGLDRVKDSWSSLEVWLDPTLSPPYILLLLSDQVGNWHIFDPAEKYRLIKSCQNYDEARLWLLEDEYELLEGRISSADIY
ncbi:hypothetical protein IQ241_13570 [Romeria aff. gracilis LEGE 07310]|uniref:Uncharacterized protein n=1 Tax=Vasconcelosia minhoensis LEGE 07310 TaxID=915328 RepID=A0A8J7APQ3_9CYAN|nr:hypothetical protein [Romeria gracilis]MBE9078309.1 hypothetical protein [Romeria aff. gracilis LEGE 07310]